MAHSADAATRGAAPAPDGTLPRGAPATRSAEHLTVGDLARMEQFDCRVLAGTGGLNRPVVWAHSCELADPWRWLGADELLMTVGICVPRGAKAQRRLITGLHAAELAGLAIGDDLKAPPLTRSMLDAADELGFPVLLVGHTTPFAAIGRTVAMASQSEQVRRLVRVSRLYEPARTAAFRDGSLLDRLSAELGHRLHVLDMALGSEVFRQQHPLDPAVTARLREETADQLARLPARLCVTGTEEVRATALALSTHRPCMLVAEGPGELDADGFLLLHVQSLVSVEVERAARERAARDDAGAELWDRLVDGGLGDEAGNLALDGFGLVGARTALGVPAESRTVAAALLGDAEVPAVLGKVRGEAAVLLVESRRAAEVVALLRERIPAIGVSASGSAVGQLPDTARQARWALQAAVASGGGVADYETAAPILLPRTVADAEHATRTVLGPLLDHDRQHGTELLHTLETFLGSDRSWRDASEALRIHRQTLGYRLRKVEAITGRSLRGTGDVAVLWMALLARRITEL
ncbi:PucR family transcriptional regulator ligand-binding domain-containing protein [Streptomyces sp. B-S-A8]|uniref:PucR family transcriptional regulator ligand-binding domain-containing protein n=1 Tax=Streptomyces solicavernae TaxID=3043614 RepID=A0ABT6RXP6_9ACTN|nr:PucR family transcriptional regulator [Streptomyces sp. B-S-A8]MDI3388451.1 PucR family transcriptional regulator ligand-binding domain-containing protein [Streptomyces sp. B-S-A8]